MIATYKEYLLRLAVKALKAYGDALDSDDPRTKFASAAKLLDGVGMFRHGGIEAFLKTTASLDRIHDERRLLNYGCMLGMMLSKCEKYEMPLPEGFAEQARQIADRAAEAERKVGKDAVFAKGRVPPIPLSSPK
jgi:hypothetical protein